MTNSVWSTRTVWLQAAGEYSLHLLVLWIVRRLVVVVLDCNADAASLGAESRLELLQLF